MKLLMKGLFFIFLFSGVARISYAQDVEFKRSGNWEFLYEIDGVNFYYIVAECHDDSNSYHREYINLKLENTNDYSIVAEWDIQTYYNKQCFNCGDRLQPEHHRAVELAPNANMEGRCMTFGDKTLRIFSRFLNYNDPESTLTRFELINKVVRKK